MPQLNALKEAIDAGHTAKHRRWQSVLHWLVKKEMDFYAKEAEGYTNNDGVVIVRAATAFYPTWERLVSSLEAYYANSHAWRLTDEPLEDYLSPERHTAPGPDEHQ
jgi:hypothetical protein